MKSKILMITITAVILTYAQDITLSGTVFAEGSTPIAGAQADSCTF